MYLNTALITAVHVNGLLSAAWVWPIVLDVEVHGFDELATIFD